MRKGLVCGALLLGATAIAGWGQSGKNAKAEMLARWHFVGTKHLSESKDLPVLKEILALKESEDLRKVAIEGFAMQLAGHFTKSTDTNANAPVAALIKPLLPDVIENESRFELVTRGAQDADWSLALKLPPDRAAEWSSNLSNLASVARMNVTPAEKGGGWSAQKDNYRLVFSTEKEWLVLNGGVDSNAARSRKFPKSSGKELLNAEINCPALAKLWNADRFQHAPKLALTVELRKGALRSEMLIDYPQPLNITPEQWNVPTDLIRDPLIGFTAIQGIAGSLAKNPQLSGLGAEKTPNQAFLWSQNLMVFTMFAAADVGNPGTVLSNFVSQVLPGMTNMALGAPTVLTNRPAVLWRGLPVIVPFLEGAEDGKSPFLVGGLFPVSQERTKAAPPELFAQLKKKNLVYYDWEITQERLKQWRPIWQAAQILQGKLFPPSASDHWIEAITPKLVNTITEVTLENPSRLKLIRQSESGLTALELVLLAHAIDPYDVMDRPPHQPGQPLRRANRPVIPGKTSVPKH